MTERYGLGRKAIDCLRLLTVEPGPQRRLAALPVYDRWSEKAVWAKLHDLTDRGYCDYGVHVVGGWLTEKGRAALEEADADQTQQATV